jgi:UDPglucose--hexose-1-phosphate uridylyltransferase
MSELLQDPTTFDWIIMAKERAKRPHEFKGGGTYGAAVAAHNDHCPFCPGNEHT